MFGVFEAQLYIMCIVCSNDALDVFVGNMIFAHRAQGAKQTVP